MHTETTQPARPALMSGTFKIGGDLPVVRLGYGAMRITGPGVWGPPKDRDEAIRVLRRAVELGVNFIDTADAYGPYISEELICEALHPYPSDLVIATKAGFVRPGPNEWHPVGRPPYLRQEAEMSLRRLGIERLDLFRCRSRTSWRSSWNYSGRARCATSACRRSRRRTSGPPSSRPGSPRSRTSTTSCTGTGRAWSTCASGKGWDSSPGSPWQPATLPARMAHSPAWPGRSGRRRLSSQSPGCSAGPR